MSSNRIEIINVGNVGAMNATEDSAAAARSSSGNRRYARGLAQVNSIAFVPGSSTGSFTMENAPGNSDWQSSFGPGSIRKIPSPANFGAALANVYTLQFDVDYLRSLRSDPAITLGIESGSGSIVIPPTPALGTTTAVQLVSVTLISDRKSGATSKASGFAFRGQLTLAGGLDTDIDRVLIALLTNPGGEPLKISYQAETEYQ